MLPRLLILYTNKSLLNMWQPMVRNHFQKSCKLSSVIIQVKVMSDMVKLPP